MPRRKVLAESQRQLFEQIPDDPNYLAQHYTLSLEDIDLVRQRRRASNRLGFAIQLCLMRHPGRSLRTGEKLPKTFIDFVAEQIEDYPTEFIEYAQRDETRREHQLILAKFFGLLTFKTHHFKELVRWLVPIAFDNPRSVFLVGALLNEMQHRCILHPLLLVTERMVAISMNQADQKAFKLVAGQLDSNHIEQLDSWLIREPHYQQSPMSRIRQPVGRPSPRNIVSILERLDIIKTIDLPESILSTMPVNRLQLLSREGNRASIQHLREFNSNRRYTIMAVCILDTRRALIDEAINMHDRVVGALMRRSQRKYAEQLQEDGKQIKHTIGMFSSMGKLLIQAKEAGTDPWVLIEDHLNWDEFCEAVVEAESLANSQKMDYLHYVETNYSQIRRYAPALLEHFDFHSASGGKDVLDAIKLLRQLNETGKRKLPEGAPTSFVSPRWKSYVYQDEGLDRRYYELCALSELRNRLRSGDVWVPGSKQFQDFDSYLLGLSGYRELRESNEIPVAIDTDFKEYIAMRSEQLVKQLSEVDDLLKQGLLDDVKIKQGRLSMSPYRSSGIPDEAKRFTEKVYAQLPNIKITDLLIEVDSWTNLTEQFTHLRSGKPPTDKQTLLTVILSDGINLGLTRMSEACPGATINQLRSTADWYIRDECYNRALAEIINYHHNTDLVDSWGDGTTSSSDGQQFPLGGTGKALGEVNARYGNTPGVLFYTHISDQYSPFHSKLINATARDATYILDGLLYHESNLKLEEHYSDTAGFTDHVFALCHLLGFKFAPRIRNIGDINLYSIKDTKQWPQLESLFGGRIKIKEIESQWEDILRLASSIRLGTVTASLIIRKLASYPRQNRLAIAIRELGRLERTLFILEWIKSPSLRGKVQAGLNKGESRNALARAVFFNRLGEVRDRSFENQCYRASGLNLVVAAIILWNTVYLEKAIKQVKENMDVPDEYLSYLSPLGWGHINLTGDYVWPDP